MCVFLFWYFSLFLLPARFLLRNPLVFYQYPLYVISSSCYSRSFEFSYKVLDYSFYFCEKKCLWYFDGAAFNF